MGDAHHFVTSVENYRQVRTVISERPAFNIYPLNELPAVNHAGCDWLTEQLGSIT